MKYLYGLLVVTLVLVSLSAPVAAAQTPSPTATQTSVPTPTVLASATPTPGTPPFNGAVPVIVDIQGTLGPGPITGGRSEVSWKGVGDSSADYELERSATASTATRDFQRLATVPGNTPGAGGLFSYRDPDMSFALEVCYRVRAVSGSLASEYSAERCIPIPPGPRPGDSGPGPFAPATGSGLEQPTRNALPLVLGGVLMLSIAALLIAPKLRRGWR